MPEILEAPPQPQPLPSSSPATFASGVDRNKLADAITAFRGDAIAAEVKLPSPAPETRPEPQKAQETPVQQDVVKPKATPTASPEPPPPTKDAESTPPSDPLTRLKQLAAVEKPEDGPKDGEDEPIPADVPDNERAIHTFKKLRKENKEFQANLSKLTEENETLRKHVEALPKADYLSSDESKQEIESLREKVTAYEQELAKHDIRKTDNFKQNVELPIAQNRDVMLKYAEIAQIDPEDVNRALKIDDKVERNKALSEAFAGLDPMNFSVVMEAAKYYAIAKNNEEYIESRALESKRMLDEEAAVADFQRKDALKKEFTDAKDRSFSTLKEKFSVLSDPSISKRVMDSGDFIMNNPTPDAMAIGGMAMETLMHVLAENMTLKKELKDIKEINQRRSESSPSIRTGSSASPSSGVRVEPDATPADRSSRLAAALLDVRGR